MEEELNLDNLEVQSEEKLKVKNRFQQLSDKVANTSKERDEAIAKANAEAEAKANAEKERDFYKDFSSNVSKYPASAEFQDKILEKVKSGYSTEDAMVAVLAKEGRLTASTPTHQPAFSPEGGSAATTTMGDKDISQASLDEKRNALLEADKSGDLVTALRGMR